MTALDELRAALAAEREGWDYEPESSVRAVGKNETDAALARVKAELAEAQKRPTLEQALEALEALDIPYMEHDRDLVDRRDVFRAIRALYGEAETKERHNG